MRPVILGRGDFYDPGLDPHIDERAAALVAGFHVVDSRMMLQRDDVVVGRYSVLPFYDEQERDLAHVGARLINTWRQHRYIADMFQWVGDLEGLTPRTWQMGDLPMDVPGAFVIKGVTNSKKFLWDTHMFAKDRADVGRVVGNLYDDTLISTQELAIRQYVPLRTHEISLHGLPITHEFRVFVAYGQVLCGAFYWSNFAEEITPTPSFEDVPAEFLRTVVDRIGDKAPFVVVDVAQTAAGDWIVIELNDGQMSGLSENDPSVLYRRLMEIGTACRWGS